MISREIKVEKILYLFIFLIVVVSQSQHIYIVSQSNLLVEILDLIDWFFYFVLLFLIFVKYKLESYKEYINNVKVLFFILFSIFVFLVSYFCSGNTVYIKGLVILLACKGASFSKLLRTLLKSYLVIITVSICLYFLGISDAGVARRGAISLGFVHPNIFAQFVLIAILLFISLFSYKLTIKQLFYLSSITAVLQYCFTKSRTTFALIILIPFLFYIVKKMIYMNKTRNLIDFFAKFGYLGMLLLTVITAVMYPISRISQLLNKIVNMRVFLNYYILKEYPPKFFGQNVLLNNNTGEVVDPVTKVGNIHTTVDNSYMISLVTLGILPTIIVALTYTLVVKMMINKRAYNLVIVSIILCLYSFCEAQMIPIYNFFVFIYLTTCHGKYDELNGRRFYDS